jgi:hypothetical protein
MLPIDLTRAEQLAMYVGDPAPPMGETMQDFDEALLELIPGIAAIEDAETRQSTALLAASGIFHHTRASEQALAGFVKAMYGRRAGAR